MCVWTKKRGSMNAVVLMATPCPKSLHGKGEKWIARNMLQGLDSRQPMTAITATDEVVFPPKQKRPFEEPSHTINRWVRVKGRYGIGAHRGLHGDDGAGEFRDEDGKGQKAPG